MYLQEKKKVKKKVKKKTKKKKKTKSGLEVSFQGEQRPNQIKPGEETQTVPAAALGLHVLLCGKVGVLFLIHCLSGVQLEEPPLTG